jgi:hypothetical protein
MKQTGKHKNNLQKAPIGGMRTKMAALPNAKERNISIPNDKQLH